AWWSGVTINFFPTSRKNNRSTAFHVAQTRDKSVRRLDIFFVFISAHQRSIYPAPGQNASISVYQLGKQIRPRASGRLWIGGDVSNAAQRDLVRFINCPNQVNDRLGCVRKCLYHRASSTARRANRSRNRIQR